MKNLQVTNLIFSGEIFPLENKSTLTTPIQHCVRSLSVTMQDKKTKVVRSERNKTTSIHR